MNEENKEEVKEEQVTQEASAPEAAPTVEPVQEAPTAVAEPTPPEKKNGKTIIIVMGLIILLLIGVVVFLLLNGDKKNSNSDNKETNNAIENNNQENTNNENNNNNENNTNTKNSNTEVNNNDAEKEITKPEVINNLSSKFDKLFGDYIYLLGTNDNDSLFGRVLEWRIKFIEMENPPKDNDYAYFVGQLPLSTIEKEYYNLFGEKIDTSIEFEGSCAKAYYDKDQNIFIQKKYGCDAGWGWFVKGYRYKYTEDNNNAYIYAAVAVHSGIEKIDILSDPDAKTVYKTLEDNESFTIDESNYESFAKYKITFKKVGNDYFFKSVEKIEAGK